MMPGSPGAGESPVVTQPNLVEPSGDSSHDLALDGLLRPMAAQVVDGHGHALGCGIGRYGGLGASSCAGIWPIESAGSSGTVSLWPSGEGRLPSNEHCVDVSTDVGNSWIALYE